MVLSPKLNSEATAEHFREKTIKMKVWCLAIVGYMKKSYHLILLTVTGTQNNKTTGCDHFWE